MSFLKSTLQRKFQYNSMNFLGLVIISVIFLFVYRYTYDSKVALLGDNALYYTLGESIHSGNGYVTMNDIHKPNHGHFPPGYPLAISINKSLTSGDFDSVKTMNGIFFLISLWFFYFLIKHLTQNKLFSFFTTILVALNGWILYYSTVIMSEALFTMLLTAILWLMVKMKLDAPFWKNPIFYLLVILSAYSYYVRTAGLSVVGLIFLYFLFRKKWLYAGSYIGLVIIAVMPWTFYLNSLGTSGYSKIFLYKNFWRPEEGMVTMSDMLGRVVDNTFRYIGKEIPSSLFYDLPINYSDPEDSYMGMGLLIFALIVFGIFKLPVKKYSWMLFLMFTCVFGLLLISPPNFYGTRYIIPIIPFLAFSLMWGIYSVVKIVFEKIQVSTSFAPAFVVIFIFMMFPGVKKRHKESDIPTPPNWKEYYSMANWTKYQLQENDVVVCRKPVMYYINSGRYTYNYPKSLDDSVFVAAFAKNNVTHVLVDNLGFSSTPQYLIPFIQRNQQKFEMVHQIGRTVLLKYKREEE